MAADASPRRRLWVTGASGYLGRRLVRAASTRGWLVDGTRVELTDPGAVSEWIERYQPDAIVHLAGRHPGSPAEALEAVNVRGTANVATAARSIAARLVHLSTDVVHDGLAAPYADDASANPRTPYGQSKARGEYEVRRRCPDAAIVRSSLIYGLDEMDRGTASFAASLATGQPVLLWTDAVRQPIWVESLVELCIVLVEHAEVAGPLNAGGDEVLSRAEFGRLLLGHWDVPGRDRAIDVVAGEASGQPLDLRMRRDRVAFLGVALPGVRAVLAGSHGLAGHE